MARVLITGMSGVGKSSVIDALGRMGCRAIDTDAGGWRVPKDGAARADAEVQPEWIWDEARMAELLDRETTVVVSGCVENQGRFYDRFDHIVLLTAQVDTILRRLDERADNPYGRSPDEQEQVVAHMREIEPILRRHATAVIDTTAMPLARVVDAVIAMVADDADEGEGRGERASGT